MKYLVARRMQPQARDEAGDRGIPTFRRPTLSDCYQNGWSRCFIGWGTRYVDQLEQELLRYRRTRPGDTIERLCEIFEHHKSYLLERWGREGTAR